MTTSTPLQQLAPTNLTTARQAVATNDYYSMCYLMLASYAYAGQDSAQNAVLSIVETFGANALNVTTGAVPNNPNLPNCVWNLQWGPFASDDNSNLMYAAQLLDQDSNQPIMGVISIRGTDIETWKTLDFIALINQLTQDLNVGTLVDWPYTYDTWNTNNPNNKVDTTGAQVAEGSLNGFQNKILQLGVSAKDKKKNPNALDIGNWAKSFATANPNVPIVVTGHSLGGCQATLLAAYLQSDAVGLPTTTQIVPNPFAGPTAGETNFAKLYDTLFANTGRRWYNTFDIVPAAFEADTFATIAYMWNGTDPVNNTNYACKNANGQTYTMSFLEKRAYDHIGNTIANMAYTQPSAGVRTMNGACGYGSSTVPDTFMDMLCLQHFPPAYQSLMGAYMQSIGFTTLNWPPPQTANS